MAVSLNSVVGFNSTGIFGSRRPIKDKGWGLCLSVANSDRVTTDTNDKGAGNVERSLSDDQFSAVNSPSLDSSAGNSQFQTSSVDESRVSNP
ncbi:hypothetical protein L1049_011704 [Liquidambar formosana]|uniref:Uncharacterized protein n=1 Tax=Liquidambar formosana TaxID=63359 RepID=A0AAP0RYS1_LIQFO